MDGDEKTCLPFSQVCFKARFLNLLIFIMAILILGPLLEEFVQLSILIDILWSAIFVSAIYAVSQKKRHIVIAILLALPMLGAIWSRHFIEFRALQAVGYLCGVAFILFAIVQMLIFIYHHKEVTKDLIIGAAVVYLLMAIMWTFIFIVVETLHPGSFNLPDIQDIPDTGQFLYFSFVTLTTLGYGDITPVTRLARSLSTLESWLGGIHVSQSVLKKSRQDDEEGE